MQRVRIYDSSLLPTKRQAAKDDVDLDDAIHLADDRLLIFEDDVITSLPYCAQMLYLPLVEGEGDFEAVILSEDMLITLSTSSTGVSHNTS